MRCERNGVEGWDREGVEFKYPRRQTIGLSDDAENVSLSLFCVALAMQTAERGVLGVELLRTRRGKHVDSRAQTPACRLHAGHFARHRLA